MTWTSRAVVATLVAAAIGGNPQRPATLSDRYPGDAGIGSDPSVVWFEDFEAGSVAAIAGRYDQARGLERMRLVADRAGGATALALTAGAAVPAVDLYKRLPDHDELYVRWYAKYEANVTWHHSGVWLGGYHPGLPYPQPRAGLKPKGDDRFSISIEPVFDLAGPRPRFDFYNYWMAMHSWQAAPTDDGTSYYGNTLVHRTDFTVDPGTWVCLEAHARLNPAANSGRGAVLEVWKNDAAVIRYDDSGPSGYWIRDKFCPAGADAAECTNYPSPPTGQLDLRMRSTTAYGLNAFWPQNYITVPSTGTLTFDQMVVATTRIGCLR